MTKVIPSEAQDHLCIADYARLHPILREYLVHYPSGGSRNLLEAKKLKRMLTRKGIPDFILFYPNKGFHGMVLELKRKDKKKSSVSPMQRMWLAKFQNIGWYVRVAYGAQDALDAFLSYLK